MRAFWSVITRPVRGINCRASIAIWIAMMIPGLVMATALGVELAGWATAQVAVQRAADLSAISGVINYKVTTNKQTAATFAARMAQVNGGVGTATPSWNSGTNTLTDNQITAPIVTGWQTSSDTAIKVTIQKTIPATVSSVFSSIGSHTVTGTGLGELVSMTAAGSGGQPCLLALNTATSAIGVTRGANVSISDCTVRSSGGVSISSADVTASATPWPSPFRRIQRVVIDSAFW
jgi:hypothetical protein